MTQAALDDLLAWLDTDRDRAAEKYESIRARLIKVFTCRGCPEAEDLADETINRVTSKLAEVSPGYRGDPALFFYGVAKKIYQEYARRRFKSVPAPLHAPAPDPHDEIEDEYECLEECIRRLPAEQRRVVLDYYREGERAKIKNRQRLAVELGITVNALRIRAHRIRATLQQCVEECLGSAPAG